MSEEEVGRVTLADAVGVSSDDYRSLPGEILAQTKPQHPAAEVVARGCKRRSNIPDYK